MKTLETLKFIGRIRSNKNRQRGFTLIELVVVLAVLGVLAAIGIPQLTGLQTTAQVSGLTTNLASEVSNQFAQDLASDDFNEESDGIDWTNEVCTQLNASNTIDGEDAIFPALVELQGLGYDVVDSDAGDFTFSRPVVTDEGEIESSVECGVAEPN